ncbi:MAG: DUF368 domain-containing protein [Prevotellaceae bacterium]|jgi:putative membrane protein|nr:DUF368 domain-containing protein [Prevotellaceae bacterium]
MSKKTANHILLALKGATMGAADVIPGVSGGTIAFITGIYEELLLTVKNIPAAFKYLIKNKFDITGFWRNFNGNFLCALLFGIALSFLSLARLMTWLLEHHPIPVWSFFFGLIMASVWFVLKDIKKWKVSYFVSLLAGMLSGYMVTILGKSQTPDGMWFIFISGALAICAMILPGISGSFILLLIGKYNFMLAAINAMNFRIILVFMLGAVTGLISFSHFLSWLLKKYHNITIAFLGGIMFGSLNKIWAWKQTVETITTAKGETVSLVEKNILPDTYSEITGLSAQIPHAITMAAIGFSLIFIVDGVASRIKKSKINT